MKIVRVIIETVDSETKEVKEAERFCTGKITEKSEERILHRLKYLVPDIFDIEIQRSPLRDK